MNLRALTASLLISTTALAEGPPLVTYPPGDDNIVSVKKGEAAPFQGQLFDTDTALRWASWLKQYQQLYELERNVAEERCSVKIDFQKELARIEQARAQATYDDLRLRFKTSEQARVNAEYKLQNPGFFKQPGVWFAAGVLFTVAVAAGGAAVVTASK